MEYASKLHTMHPDDTDTNRKTVFVVPHPDDTEVMFGHAAIAANQYGEAWAVVATDGSASKIDSIGKGFVRNGRRQEESERGLACLGFDTAHQIYLYEPDKRLQTTVPRLTNKILGVVANIKPDRIITFGQDGYDGHEDHKAIYRAVVMVMRQCLDAGSHLELLVLDASHQGDIRYNGHTATKLKAMSQHESQKVGNDLVAWGDCPTYTPLIKGAETYRIVPAEQILTDTTHTTASDPTTLSAVE